MRVLFTLHPATGHLHPMLGFSAALRDAGHEVMFATSGPFVPRVEEHGERAVAVGLDWLQSDGPVVPPDPETDPDGSRTLFPRMFLGQVAHAMADDLTGLVRERRPDVIVRESVEFAGAAVAERSGVPFATFDMTFPIDFHIMTTTGDVEDATELEALRAHVGLGRASDPDWFRGQLVISTFPAAYRRGQGVQPTRAPDLVIRPNIDVRSDVPAPPWVDDLDEAVYVSFGTVFPRYFPHVLQTAITGAAAVGRPTVATHGPAVDVTQLELPDGPDLHVHRYVPQGPVLDRCGAAVVHGGTGTTVGALLRGVPLVVVPLGADQFGHARSIRDAGAGIALAHADLTPDAVASAVRTVLEDGSYRDNAAYLGGRFSSLPGPERAVAALQDLVARHV